MAKRSQPGAILGPVPLTAQAAASDFVVLATTGVGKAFDGFCDASSMDWRGWMPIYLARALGPERPLLVTDVKPLDGRPGRCRLCRTGSWKEQHNFFDCDEWVSKRQHHIARFLIIVGSGDRQQRKPGRPEGYPDIQDALSKPWISKGATTVWHFPIIRHEEIDRNKVFPRVFPDFRVMRDGAWVKPVEREALEQWTDWCREQPRKNDLLYIARWHGWKGQLDFIENVDPSLIRGYTVHFYSSVHASSKPDSQPSLVEKIAKRRGIKVVIHKRPQTQEVVARHSCSAKGLIHFARKDANPRAVDESIINGMPVFVSRQSHLPVALRKQSFVKMTNNRKRDEKTDLNRDLATFMARVESPEIRDKVLKFAREHLDPPRAYFSLCRNLGICASEKSGEL
eukprot:jgi/Tetstr1/444159/TSEL_032053.t1